MYIGNCNLHVTYRFWREPPNCKLVRSYVLACEFHDVPHIESTFFGSGGGLRKSTERERRDSNSLTLIALTLLIEPVLVTHEFLMFFISFLCLRDIVMMLCLLVSTYLFVRCNNHKCVKTPLWRGDLYLTWLDHVSWCFMFAVMSRSWLILVQVPSLYLWLWEIFTVYAPDLAGHLYRPSS